MKEQSELKPMNGLEQGLEMFCSRSAKFYLVIQNLLGSFKKA